jgi:PIN domain nuclease of toxin-antitoxin system
VRLLLDTHIAVWALLGSPRLSAKATQLVAAPANAVFVSAVSVLEIAIKQALGKPSGFPFSGQASIGHFMKAGYQLLNITPEHAAGVETLPRLHGDPFDRLLVAQAMSEPMYLVTADRQLFGYGSTIIPC